MNDQMKDKETMISLWGVRAQIALLQGNYDQARTCWQEGLDISEELGNRMSSLWLQSHLGYLALFEGHLTEARDIFTETARAFFNDKSVIGVVFNLEGMAGLYVAIGKTGLAAQLIGWADATRERINDTRPLLEQADVDRIITACIIKMGEAAFSEAYDEGQKMTMDEAVTYALQDN